MNTSGRFLGRMCERVKKLDILAPEVGFSVQGDSGVKSFIGVIISLACIGLFIGASVYGTLESLRTDRPSVVQEYSSSSVYPGIDVLKDQKFPAIMVFTNRGPVAALNVSRYVTIVGLKEHRQFVDNDASKPPKITYDRIPMIPCREYTQEERDLFGPPQTPVELSAYNQNALCPQLEDLKDKLTVKGKVSDPESENIYILAYPCAVELASNGCASAKEISSLSIFLLPNLMNIDLSNYEKPITSSFNSDEKYVINPSFMQQVTTRLKMVEVWNSNGMFTEDTLVVNQSDIGSQRSQLAQRDPTRLSCKQSEIVNDPTCEPYAIFTISSSGHRTKYTRGYKGNVEIVGDIGGIRDIIFTLGFYLYVIYNDREVKKRLVASVFKVSQKKAGLQRANTQSSAGEEPLGMVRDSFSLRKICCCRRKQQVSPVGQADNANPAPNEFDEDEAYEQIEKNLDVVNLIRKLNFIEVLLNFFRIEDHEQISCISQASYTLGQKGVRSSMAGLRVIGVGTAVSRLAQNSQYQGDYPGHPTSEDRNWEAKHMFGADQSKGLDQIGLGSSPSHMQSHPVGSDNTDREVYSRHKPRDDLMKELMTFISAQSAWADRYYHPASQTRTETREQHTETYPRSNSMRPKDSNKQFELGQGRLGQQSGGGHLFGRSVSINTEKKLKRLVVHGVNLHQGGLLSDRKHVPEVDWVTLQ